MAVDKAGASAPVTTVIFEVEYFGDVPTARHLALRHARWLFREDEVSAVLVHDQDARVVQKGLAGTPILPITERYLQDD